MSDGNASEGWDVVLPEDAEALQAELRRHGLKPGEVVHIDRARQADRVEINTASSAKPPVRPAFFKSIRSGEEDLGRRSKEILRSEFPALGE